MSYTDSIYDEIKTIVKYVMTNTRLDQICHLNPTTNNL